MKPGQLRRAPLKRGKGLRGSGSLSRSGRPQRHTGVRRKDPKRRVSEFARCYHSRERVRFVKSLPCVVCGHGPCDNAHIETGGMGRKADYTKIVPLCCMPMDHPYSPGYPRGHHGFFHQVGRAEFETSYRRPLNLDALAAETERRWQRHVARSTPSTAGASHEA